MLLSRTDAPADLAVLASGQVGKEKMSVRSSSNIGAWWLKTLTILTSVLPGGSNSDDSTNQP